MTSLQTGFKSNATQHRHCGWYARRPAACARPATAAARARNARAARAQGFTMLELLIALVIIAILASVALPAYNNTLVRSNRAATQSYLLDLANREEQYLLDARSYTTTVTDLLVPPSAVSAYYTVTIAVPSGLTLANAYTITATPVATIIQKNDGNLTINQDGQKTGTW